MHYWVDVIFRDAFQSQRFAHRARGEYTLDCRMRRRKKKQKHQQPKLKSPDQPSPHRKSLSLALTGLLGAATLIGGVAAAVTFLPRLNVNPGGDFSNPASIQFGITNTNFVPLRRPSYGIMACEIVYGVDNPSLRKPETPCNISRIQKMPTPERGQRWLEMDDTYTLRLEDMFRVESLPITRANLIVMISYYPFYLPWRLQKLFGFRTAQGSDGKLYWRSYPVD